MARFRGQNRGGRQRADIVEIIGAHVRLKRAGRNFVGLCPFHNEKTPSFSVNAERGFFHCFGCGAGGTVFDFMMKVEGLSFPEAMRSLARRYGVTLPERDDEAGPARRRARRALRGQSDRRGVFCPCAVEDGRRRAGARVSESARHQRRNRARVHARIRAGASGQSLAQALEKRGLIEAAVKAGLVKRDATGTPRHVSRAR